MCARWEQVATARCTQWRTEWSQRCDSWRTEWTQRCDQYKTTSETVCDRWEQEWSQRCSDWKWPWSWICIAWTWVSTWVCRAWVVVTTTVCVLWTWISGTVCDLWVWVSSAVCDLWVVVTSLVCRLWVFTVEVWCAIYCSIRRFLAPNEFSERKSECIYGWTSAYRIENDLQNCVLRIVLRLRFVPDPGVTAAQITALEQVAEPAIERAWSGQFPLTLRDGTCTCESYRVAVDVQFVRSGEHHAIRVQPGSGRADMTNWFVTTTGGTAAHEAGHMFGNPDEYADSACPNRVVTSDGSIMQTSATGSVKERHYANFARWLSNRTCCEYSAGR
jgi:hypothetical protein